MYFFFFCNECVVVGKRDLKRVNAFLDHFIFRMAYIRIILCRTIILS